MSGWLIGGAVDHRAAVVAVSSAVGRCTGTYLGDGLVVTAAHCVPRDARPGDVLVAIEGAGAGASRAVFADDARDLAVVGFDDARVPAAIAPLPLVPADHALTDADLGSEVVLVGFGVDRAPLAVRHSGLSTLVGLDAERATVGAAPGQARACFGDSGGPLLVVRDGREYVAGVLSTGAADCSGVDHYVRIDAGAGRALVDAHTGDAAGCSAGRAPTDGGLAWLLAIAMIARYFSAGGFSAGAPDEVAETGLLPPAHEK